MVIDYFEDGGVVGGRQGFSSSITVNINGGFIDQSFVENELAESVKKAVERGSDFGLN